VYELWEGGRAIRPNHRRLPVMQAEEHPDKIWRQRR